MEETRARWGVGTLLQIPPHSLNPGAAVGGVAKGKAVPPVPGDRTHRLDSVPQKSQHSYYSQELSTVQPRTMSWTLPGEKSLSGSHWLPSSLRFLPGPCNQGVGIWEAPPTAYQPQLHLPSRKGSGQCWRKGYGPRVEEKHLQATWVKMLLAHRSAKIFPGMGGQGRATEAPVSGLQLQLEGTQVMQAAWGA